jgi:hypothetical protein
VLARTFSRIEVIVADDGSTEANLQGGMELFSKSRKISPATRPVDSERSRNVHARLASRLGER